jgi:hypothetical protein
MVDYAANDMIGFFYNYFKKENLMYEFYGVDDPFLIPNKLVGEIFHFCLDDGVENHNMLYHEFNYLKNKIENPEDNIYDKNIRNLNKNKYLNNNNNIKNDNDNIKYKNKNKNKKKIINNKKRQNNIRNLGEIIDPDWDKDKPDELNTQCIYLKNDINMLYSSFYSFSDMDKRLTAITATVAYLGYICAIAIVFTIKKFENYWGEKGKYNYNGNNNDNDSNSDNSSNSNSIGNNNNDNKINKKNNKKIGNYIKIDENLKKNLINTTKSKKKSTQSSNKDEEEDEDDED